MKQKKHNKCIFLVSYTQDKFPETYVPTVFDNVTQIVTLKIGEKEQQSVSLDIWDTAGFLFFFVKKHTQKSTHTHTHTHTHTRTHSNMCRAGRI